jgi:hypothetical protein
MFIKSKENQSPRDEKMYEGLFNHSLNGIAYCKMEYDEEGKPSNWTYLAINSSFEQLTGLKNAVGKKVTDLIPGIQNQEPKLFEVYGRVAAGGQPELFEVYLDALKMWFTVSVYCPEKGYFIAVFNVNAMKLDDEITRLKKEIQELKKMCDMEE